MRSASIPKPAVATTTHTFGFEHDEQVDEGVVKGGGLTSNVPIVVDMQRIALSIRCYYCFSGRVGSATI
jgi:hypothetical protein